MTATISAASCFCRSASSRSSAGRRRRRVVVAPPEGRRPSGVAPQVELARQVVPRTQTVALRWASQAPIRRAVSLAPSRRRAAGSGCAIAAARSMASASRCGVSPASSSDHRPAAPRQRCRAHGLLGFGRGGERDEHGAGAGGQDIHHGIIASLGDRDMAAREQPGKIAARRFDNATGPRAATQIVLIGSQADSVRRATASCDGAQR